MILCFNLHLHHPQLHCRIHIDQMYVQINKCLSEKLSQLELKKLISQLGIHSYLYL